MANQAFARKKRQLKQLSEKLDFLLRNEAHKATEQIKRLSIKIKQLLWELATVVSKQELKRIMGAAALLFGLSLSHESAAQSFTAPLTNPFGITATVDFARPAFADLDNDGDLDMMVGEYYGGLKYFQNTGSATAPQFAAPVFAPFGIDTTGIAGVALPAFADLDGDGDFDLMVGISNYYGENLRYFENTGTAAAPQFGSSVASPFGLSATKYFAIPTFADLDNDGDTDLLIGQYSGEMAYYQNTGSATAPQFGTAQANAFGLDSTYILAAPAFADLDQDGDYDLLVGEIYKYSYGGSSYDADLQYFENTGTPGSPQFAAPIANPFGITPVEYYSFPAFADLDGDGDTDLMVGEDYGNMKYFEDTSSSGIRLHEMAQPFQINVFPLPASEYLEVASSSPLKQIEIIDLNGKLVLSIENARERIQLGNLAKGQYLLKAINHNEQEIIQKIQIQ